MRVEVSVIVAVHNESPALLKAALDSIKNQTFRNFEVVICNDASCSATSRFLYEYVKNADKSADITVIHNKSNMGAAKARNRAMHSAKGKYIAIMDADDISDKRRLELQVNYLNEKSETAFVGTKGEMFDKKPGDMAKQYWFVEKPQKRDFLFTLPFVHASIMFRREALEAVGGYREIERVKRSEDYDLLMRLYEKGYTGENLPEVLYWIRTDINTLKRRKYRYRFNEAAVKLEGFTKLELLPEGVLYAIKPLIVGLIPSKVLSQIKDKYYNNKQ